MAKRQKMSKGAKNVQTILDYLNEDCWRAVLSYVPARDVMRTERASRRWQTVVLRHLRGVRIHVLKDDDKRIDTISNACCLNPKKYKSFKSWTNKLGSSVVETFCNNRESLKITKNCPNLETLQLIRMHNNWLETFTHNLNDCFKFLQGVHFYGCSISDNCVSQFIGDKVLKELQFTICRGVTGECLKDINTSNLKTLTFDICRGLNSQLLSSVDRFNELTQLTITGIDCDLAEEIQLVLDKMPKLEQLEIFSDVRMTDQFTEPLCRLTHLKHLSVNFLVVDEDVEAVARCCKELRTLELLECQYVTPGGVEALARHGARLASLRLHDISELQDAGVLAIIRGCPELTFLDVGGAILSPLLPARAEAAWREARPGLRLKLDLTGTNLDNEDEALYLYEDEEQYEEMKRHYKTMKTKYGDLIILFDSEESLY